jgi:endoglucanase
VGGGTGIDTIAAVDFDMGRNGVAYRDLTSANESGKPDTGWNPSKTYRNDGVDLADGAGGLHVADMQPGEWLKYTFTAANAGRYGLQLHGSRGDARVTLNGVVVGKATIGQSREVALLEGRNTIIIEAASAGIDLQSLQFTPPTAASERR